MDIKLQEPPPMEPREATAAGYIRGPAARAGETPATTCPSPEWVTARPRGGAARAPGPGVRSSEVPVAVVRVSPGGGHVVVARRAGQWRRAA